MQIRNAFVNYWNRIIGSGDTFALQERMYHAVCIIAMTAMLYNIPFNLAIGLPLLSLICGVILLVDAFLYYLSRFKRQSSLSITISCALWTLLFIMTFFLNSGVTGPSHLFFLALIVLAVAVADARNYHFWVPLNIVAALLLIAIEYRYPHLVPNTYLSRHDRFIDLAFSFVLTSSLVYMGLNFIRISYDAAKKEADNRTAELTLQHDAIVRQKNELEVVNSEKNKLLSVIAHDLRSPIANLQNYLELLVEGGLDQQEKTILEHSLLQNTKDTALLLSSLLLWSRSQMDGLNVSLKKVSLRDLLGHWLDVDQAAAGKKDIHYAYYLDPALYVVADEAMLMIVIRNLSGNAIKFTPAGGWIKISAKAEQDTIVISITDNGPGISLQRQPNVFSMKMDSMTGTANEKGSGLGLALCKEFTELQGGKIAFTSSEKDGTTFIVTLPAHPAEAFGAIERTEQLR